MIAGIGNVQSRLDTGDTAAYDQRPLGNGAFAGLQRGIQMHLGDGSPHEDHSLLRGFLHILVDPGAMLTDIGDLH